MKMMWTDTINSQSDAFSGSSSSLSALGGSDCDWTEILGPKMNIVYRLSWLMLCIMILQSVLGLVFHDYYRDVEWIMLTWYGNDAVTLMLGVPLLGWGLILSMRERNRGHLIWLGLLGYNIYNYAFYLFGAALNVFFPLYLIMMILSIVILVLLLSNDFASRIAKQFNLRTPVRLIGGYLIFVGVGLTSVWLGIWAAYVFKNIPTPVEPEAFKLVAALDITLMVPALIFGGLLLWRKSIWGYTIASIAGIQATLYLTILAVNSIVSIQSGLAEAPGELPLWGSLVLFTAIATVLLIGNSATEKTT